LADAEVDHLIGIMRHAEGDRASLMAVFYATFKDGGDPEPCRPCSGAILNAAGR